MRTLRIIVMRHAKSSWSTGLDDHARPLNDRGKKDAPKIGAELDRRGWVPELVLSSDSERTRQTVAGLLNVWGEYETTVRFVPEFYLGSYRNVESALDAMEGGFSTVMVLGHNPGWEEVVHVLSGQSIQLTTGNAVLLEKSANDWVDALYSGETWDVRDVLRPREPRVIPR